MRKKQQKTTEKTDDKNLQAITAKIDEVKSYKAELNLTATLDDLNEENLMQKSTLLMEIHHK